MGTLRWPWVSMVLTVSHFNPLPFAFSFLFSSTNSMLCKQDLRTVSKKEQCGARGSRVLARQLGLGYIMLIIPGTRERVTEFLLQLASWELCCSQELEHKHWTLFLKMIGKPCGKSGGFQKKLEGWNTYLCLFSTKDYDSEHKHDTALEN